MDRPRHHRARHDFRSGRRSSPTAAIIPDGELITGVHAVAEALAAGERFERILIGTSRRDDAALKSILDAAKHSGITVAFEGDDAFRRLGPDRHQHVAGIVRHYAYAEWPAVRSAVKADQDALVVLLDHVEDPHNLGAVMRNAEGAGATAVVIPDRRSASVTPAARRAAAGAASHLRVARVPNMARVIEELKADGCWIYGLTSAPGSVPYTKVDFTGRCAIAVGGEGKGLSRLVAERCDRLAAIPLHGKVASLNASSAAAIALFEAVRQRAQRGIVTSRNKRSDAVNP